MSGTDLQFTFNRARLRFFLGLSAHGQRLGAAGGHLAVEHLYNRLLIVVTHTKMRAAHAEHADGCHDLKTVIVAGTLEHVGLDLALLQDHLGNRLFFHQVQTHLRAGRQDNPRTIAQQQADKRRRRGFYAFLFINQHAFFQHTGAALGIQLPGFTVEVLDHCRQRLCPAHQVVINVGRTHRCRLGQNLRAVDNQRQGQA